MMDTLQHYLAQQLGPGRHAVALHSTEGLVALMCTVTPTGAVLFYSRLPEPNDSEPRWLRTVRGDEIHTHDRQLSAESVRQQFRELARAKGIRTVWIEVDPDDGYGSAP